MPARGTDRRAFYRCQGHVRQLFRDYDKASAAAAILDAAARLLASYTPSGANELLRETRDVERQLRRQWDKRPAVAPVTLQAQRDVEPLPGHDAPEPRRRKRR